MSSLSRIPVLGSQVVLARDAGDAIDQACQLPRTDDAILGLFRPMTVAVLQSSISGADDPRGPGRAVGSFVERRISGNWQPGAGQKLKQQREGGRAWRNGTLFAGVEFDVEVNSLVRVDGVPYTVVTKADWNAAGHIDYGLLEAPPPNDAD